MSYTRRQLVEDALDEIGFSPDDFDMPAAKLQSAARKLDSMIAQWNARGVLLGWPIPSSPELTDLDTETGLPDAAWEAVVTNLALRIAPSFGKPVMQETKSAAKMAKNTLFAKSVATLKRSLGTLPSGAGNKPHRFTEFIVDKSRNIDVGSDELEFG